MSRGADRGFRVQESEVRASVVSFSYHCDIETLTFLFTDIEGSTNLVRRVGEDLYARMLADHHDIVRRRLASHGGREIGTQGDSFFATFTSTRSCVAAALEIQRALTLHQWPAGEQVKVRMGIHAGEAVETETGLVGYEVHRAARIAAVAHGGQVLLSSAATGLVEDSLPADVALRDLGSHRLKDLGRPEVIFQLLADGLDDAFTPLRSLDNPELPNNLPASLNPFIGREAELAEVRQLVLENRLLTLTGAGGSGKTRLALQAAAEMLDGSGDGVWLVELAPIRDPQMVASAFAEAMSLRARGDLSDLDSLVEVLRDQRALLVVDNCEHVVEAVADVVERIGRHCASITVIATSREPLGVRGEEVYRVRSMAVPAAEATRAADLEGVDAADLFVARARSLNRSFALDDVNAALVAAVCRRLDGIPLAIELAAARLSTMSLVDLYDRLDQRFRLLTGGSRNALPRQQTLAATVAWSYDLLSEPEREVLLRLSVFVNGFDLAAAEMVATTPNVDVADVVDILGSLVNKSLVIAEHSSTTLRYHLLETIRQYAAEQLVRTSTPSEIHEIRRGHAEYYRAQSEEAAASLWGGPHQVEWMQKLSEEWDNIHAAFAFFDASAEADQVMRLSAALFLFLMFTRRYEVIPYIESALERDTGGSPLLRGWSLIALGELRWTTRSVERDELANKLIEGEELFRSAEVVARSIGDVELLSYSLASLGAIAGYLGNREAALELLAEAITRAEECGSESLLGGSKMYLSWQYPQGERASLLAEIEEHFRRAQDARGLGAVCSVLGEELLYAGRGVEEPLRLARVAVATAEQLGDDYTLVQRLANVAILQFAVGEVEAARVTARRALTLCRHQRRSLLDTAGPLCALAWCATSDGDFVRGARLIAVFDELVDGLPFPAWSWAPIEQSLREANIARLIEGLGEVEYANQRKIGLQLSFNNVVNLALDREN